MDARPQHTPSYRHLCGLMRRSRAAAGLTHLAWATALCWPPSYVDKCDRRIDTVELVHWCRACGVAAAAAVAELERVV